MANLNKARERAKLLPPGPREKVTSLMGDFEKLGPLTRRQSDVFAEVIEVVVKASRKGVMTRDEDIKPDATAEYHQRVEEELIYTSISRPNRTTT